MTHQSTRDCVIWTPPVKWSPRSYPFRNILHTAHAKPHEDAQVFHQVYHYRQSLFMQFRACSICRFRVMVLRKSNPHA